MSWCPLRKVGVLVAIGSCLVSLIVGCKGDTPAGVEDLGQLKGRVSYNGRPLVHGTVQFQKDGKVVCAALIEQDGTYETPLLPGEYKVGIVTMIEPKEAMKIVKEGHPDMIGAVGGRPPERAAKETQIVKAFDPYDRLPSLAAVLDKASAADRSALEAVHKQYASPESSKLTVTVKKGSNTQDFDLK